LGQPFHLDDLVIHHENSLFKVGTDSLLLGAYASHIATSRMLEPCCGCGLITLMVARKQKNAIFTGIDLDQKSIAEAEFNAHQNKLNDRIRFTRQDFHSFISDKFDLIVMNPPYFDAGLLPSDSGRAQSRHNLFLDQVSIIEHSQPLLIPGGNLILILPYSEKPEIIDYAMRYQLFIKERMIISSYPGKKPIRDILWFKKYESDQSITEFEFFIQNSTIRKDWSDQYKSLLTGFKKF